MQTHITVVKAELSSDRKIDSKQNLYCFFSFKGKEFKTYTNSNCGNEPVWLESFSVDMDGKDDNKLEVQIFNELSTLKDSLIGKGCVDISHLKDNSTWMEIKDGNEIIGKLLVTAIPHEQASKQKVDFSQGYGQKAEDNVKGQGHKLTDIMDKAICKEVPVEKETKIAGTKGSQSKTEPMDKKSKESSLKDVMDKTAFKESGFGDDLKDQGHDLCEIMDKAICKEVPVEKETKIAGTGFSQSKGESKDKQSKGGSLKDMMDKATFQESGIEDSKKITGISNLPTSDFADKKNEAQGMTYQEKFKLGENQDKAHAAFKHDMAGLLDKASFTEASNQSGRKIGGLKNS